MTVQSSAVDLTPRDAAARAELVRLLRCYTAAAVRFARAFAERHGLHPTDWGALLTVVKACRAGAPLTLGELGDFLGLSSGATRPWSTAWSGSVTCGACATSATGAG